MVVKHGGIQKMREENTPLNIKRTTKSTRQNIHSAVAAIFYYADVRGFQHQSKNVAVFALDTSAGTVDTIGGNRGLKNNVLVL